MNRLSGVCSKSFLSAKKKQTHQVNELYHLKVLIPTRVIGPIIGKSGSIITNLENTYHVKITISSINDIYPGSNDRVCLISGDMTENILAVNDYIMTEVSAMPDKGDNLCFHYHRKINFERSKQVKFFIPENSAAKIIGLRGKTINWMKSTSGSFIQISQSSRDLRLYERCIIVAGDLESNKKACRMIFSIVAEDTTKATFYTNLSYSNIGYPIPNAFPSGPALAAKTIHRNIETSKKTDESRNISGHASNKTESSKCSEFLSTIQTILVENAYNASIIDKAKKAFRFLIRHDILSVCSPVILNYWLYNPPVGRCADNASAAALENESVSSKISPAIDGNASVSFSYRPTAVGSASVSFSDISTTETGRTSVSTNVRPALNGKALPFNDISTMDGNAFVSFRDRPGMGGNTFISFTERPEMGRNASTPFFDIPTFGNKNASVSFNDTARVETRNASASFSDTSTVGSYPSDATNWSGNLMNSTLSENLSSSSVPSGRNQDAVSFHYLPLWNHFSSPLVSINNCSHINFPNYHPGCSELPHDDLHYPMIAEEIPVLVL